VSDAPVYESDPGAAPDAAFEPGSLSHLVPGNRGRLLDARRTPIVVTRLLPDVGMFEVEIAAFEDAGARWEIELERVGGYQFAPRQPLADEDALTASQAAIRRLDVTTEVPCSDHDRRSTLERIDARCEDARRLLPGTSPFTALEGYMDGLGLSAMEHAFAERFVSNPGSGELVKGHAMVLARLGLCPYEGKIQRSPDLFAGEWAEPRRAEHIVARLAFVRELFRERGHERVTLYRGAASERRLDAERPQSFVSATFDLRVAEAHFAGGPSTVAASLVRQAVPVERLFMTHVETRAMNRQFRESEAVLIGDPGNPLF
jgi:hypothetical protein